MVANARKVDRGDTEVGCPVRHDDDGIWRITGYSTARAFLRDTGTVQAGLGIETMNRMPARMRRPVLYRDGPEHREHRRQTAKFFTAKRVDQSYRATMERVAVPAHTRPKYQLASWCKRWAGLALAGPVHGGPRSRWRTSH